MTGVETCGSSDLILAKKILQRNSPLAKHAIVTIGFEIVDNELKMINEPLW